MPVTKPSLIHRRNFTLSGAHDSALINTLTLGTIVYSCIIKITSTKWAQKKYRLLLAAPSLISRPIQVWKLKVDYEQ